MKKFVLKCKFCQKKWKWVEGTFPDAELADRICMRCRYFIKVMKRAPTKRETEGV